MKRLLPSLVFGFALLLLPGLAWAQQGTITGTVTEGDTGDPLPGATVQIPSLQTGTATDSEGNFRIAVEPGEYTLRVSFVGYQTSQRTVTVQAGSTTRVRFQLGVSQAELDEVVVTGQQLERQARSLGYSVSTVGGEEAEIAGEENLIKNLSGKLSGIDITSQSGNVGGGARIILRGIASLGGDNQPLFVVDGVPVSNSNVSSGDRLVGTYDTGNKAGQLDPNNIESISVLKGGAAAALYGQRAKNGVILIETKQGTEGRAGAQFSSSVTTSRPLVLPDFQNQYGPGDFGKYDVEDLDGWGPRMRGQEVEIYTGETVPLTPAENNVSNFYRDGVNVQNNVSFSNAGDFGDYRLGFTSTNNQGIVPEASLDRYSINANAGTQALDGRLSARATTNYVKEGTVGRVAAGGNDPNTLVGIVNGLPRNLSAETLENNYKEGGEQLAMNDFVNNPYWVAKENQYTTDVERLFGSVKVSFDVLDWLTVQERVGSDLISEERREPNAKSTLGEERGAFTDDVYREREVDHDFQIQTENEFGEDFDLDVVLGNNINQQTFERMRNQATNLNVGGLFNYQNALNNSPTNFFEQRRLIGAYGNATVGFRDYAFLEVSGRNDWSSTLPKENRSFFYPSVSLSMVFTDLLDQEYDLEIPGISYGKLRANYAEVGSDEDPYQLQFTFNPQSAAFGQFGTDIQYPFNGLTAFGATGTIPPTDLKPQRKKSWEIGAELGFFNGRVNLDFTYYDERTEDQIISLPQAESSGFNFRRTNVGTVSNKGIEIDLRAGLVTRENFSWRINGNFSQNDNVVESLAPGVEELTLQSGFNSLQVRARPGEEIGLFGVGWARGPNGNVLIDEDTGLRIAGNDKRLGDLYPDFKVGFSNTLSFWDFQLGFLIDWKQGGNVYSSTVQDLRSSGLAAETAQNREGTFVDEEGVIVTERAEDGSIVDTRPNDVPVQSMEDFWQAHSGQNIIEAGVFDASYIKLREVTLSFSFPQSWLSQTRLQSGSLELKGRNLLLLSSNVPHIDPETNLFGAGANIGQGIEFNNVPNTTSFGATLNLSF